MSVTSLYIALIVGALCVAIAANVFDYEYYDDDDGFVYKRAVACADPAKTTVKSKTKAKKNHCEENQLLLELARLYISSPERIVMLLTMHSMNETCRKIEELLQHINHTMSTCIPLPKDNLYMKLRSGLIYYDSYICGHDYKNSTKKKPKKKSNKPHVNNYHDCIRELRDDYIDCQGPGDWFEKRNKTIVCQYYRDIVNCNYIKTGLLCGLKTALLVRTFTDEIMQKVVKHKCKMSSSLPHIDDPMPSRGHRIVVNKCRNYIRLFSINVIIYIFFN